MTATTNPRADGQRPIVLGVTTPSGFGTGDLTSPAFAAEAHALVDTTILDPVTELRIHGVSGSNGPTMLEHPVSVQVAGDALAGFHRRWTPAGAGGASVGWRLEAYSWGGLTEARLASASWILLAPFMLYNVAHYMLPTRDGRERLHAVADATLRLLALAATLQIVLGAFGALLDVVALQAIRLPGGVPATVALLGVLAFIGVLWLVSVQTANSYEARKPAGASPPQPLPGPRWPLAEPAFWRGKDLVDRQRALHTVAALAAVAVVAALPGWGDVAHGLCLVVDALVLAFAVVVTPTAAVSRYEVAHREAAADEGRPQVGSGERGLAWLIAIRPRRIVVISIAAAAAMATIVVDLLGGTWTGRSDVTDELTAAWFTLTAAQAILLLVFGAAVWSLRPKPVGPAAPLPGPYLGGQLSTAVATLAALLGGLLAAAVSIAAARPFGSPVPTGRTLTDVGTGSSVVAIPWPLYAFAAAVVGFAVAGVVMAIRLYVLFCHSRAAHGSDVDRSYPALCLPTTKSYGDDQRRVAGAWAVGDLADHTGPVAAVLAAGGVLAVALAALFLGTSLVDAPLMNLLNRMRIGAAEVATLVGATASALTLIVLGISGWLVNLLRRAYADGAQRRTIGALWDVGTFWPRATHPFAPPCYAERAVPEVVDRIATLTGYGEADEVRTGLGPQTDPDPLTLSPGPVLLTGYSQGSILAPAAVAQLPAKVRADVALLTLACPARRLYGRAFPAFFGPEYLAALPTLLGGQERWANAVRRSDYIGSWVGRPPGTPQSCAALSLVDVWCDDPVALVPDGRPPAPIHRHSNWWPEPQVGPLANRLIALLRRPIPNQADNPPLDTTAPITPRLDSEAPIVTIAREN